MSIIQNIKKITNKIVNRIIPTTDSDTNDFDNNDTNNFIEKDIQIIIRDKLNFNFELVCQSCDKIKKESELIKLPCRCVYCQDCFQTEIIPYLYFKVDDNIFHCDDIKDVKDIENIQDVIKDVQNIKDIQDVKDVQNV